MYHVPCVCSKPSDSYLQHQDSPGALSRNPDTMETAPSPGSEGNDSPKALLEPPVIAPQGVSAVQDYPPGALECYDPQGGQPIQMRVQDLRDELQPPCLDLALTSSSASSVDSPRETLAAPGESENNVITTDNEFVQGFPMRDSEDDASQELTGVVIVQPEPPYEDAQHIVSKHHELQNGEFECELGETYHEGGGDL